jgi:hypothetical protein
MLHHQLAEPGLKMDRLARYLPQQSADARGIDGVSLAPQPGRHPAYAIRWAHRI